MIEYITNKLFVVPFVAFILAQTIKNIVFWYHDKKISLHYLITNGGMPSAHSAVMSSITTALFFEVGPAPIFFLSLFVTLIIIRDSFGVRLESGRQAMLINKLMTKVKLEQERMLQELEGHTKTQVFFGIVLGIFVGVVGYVLFV